jgi:CRP-like cAMP-binding protein
VIRDWRGFAETDTHDDTGKRTSLIKFSGLLRSAGGIQFGNIITGAKARLKARRLVKDFTSAAKPDPQTSQLILINFDNRRIGSGEREHLIQGINLQNNNQLFSAFKSFSKAILVCKQLHLPTMCRGIVQFQRGKFFSAVKDFSEAIKFIESSTDKINLYRLDLSIARFNRGMTYFRLGDDMRGVEDLEYSIECDPDNVHIREMLVYAYRRSNEYIPAIEHCIQLHEAQNQMKQVEKDEKRAVQVQEMAKRVQFNKTRELMKALGTVERTTNQIPPVSTSPSSTLGRMNSSSAGRNPDVRRVTSDRRTLGGAKARPGTSPPSSSPLSLLNGRLQTSTISSAFSFGDDHIDQSGVDNSIIVKRTEITEYQFPSLKDRKNAYIKKKELEERSQESVFLDSFKHAHGFKKHLYDSLFICLSSLQDSLITLPAQRSAQQLQLISKTLKSFPIFRNNNENELNDISACVEYRTITTKSTIFYQDDPVDALILVLTGQLQLKLESGEHNQILGTLNPFECYGELSLLFRNKYSLFLENLHQICLDVTKPFRVMLSSGGDEDEEQEHDHDPDHDLGEDGGGDVVGSSLHKSMTLDKFDRMESYPRSLQPGSFMSCKVASPSELLLIHSHDFDRMLRDHFERQFHDRINLFTSSHLFDEIFSRHEIVRLARMSVLRHYHQGEVILSQGDKPDFLYFVAKGVCRVMKKPDPTESLVRRLGELKNTALNYDQKYVFHHRLRGTFKPSTTTSASASSMSYKTAAEEERENLTIEIKKLETQVMKEKQIEARRQEEEDELRRLGRVLPNQSVHISTLFWPQLFGEACLLQPNGGTSLGTVIAETVCDIICIHRTHLQTFHVEESLLQRVKDRSVHYPPDDTLVRMLESNVHWDEFKKELIDQLPKDKWPVKKKV